MTDKTLNDLNIFNIDNSNNIWSEIKKKNNINQISIFIFSYISNQILFLIGKESNNSYQNKTDTDLISNFRGNIINDESIPQAAGRLLFEKTMNRLIEPFEFEKLIVDNKIKYVIEHKKIIFLYQVDYKKYCNIPEFYGKIFKYLTLCTTSNSMNNWIIESCPIGFLDKSELYWTNKNDITNNKAIYKKKFINELYEIIDIINDIVVKNEPTKNIQTSNSYKPFWYSV